MRATRWLALAAPVVLWALGCTALSGLDDKLFDLDAGVAGTGATSSTGGSAGAGAGGSGGGGASGGSGGACVEHVAVAPRVLDPAVPVGAPLGAAVRGDLLAAALSRTPAAPDVFTVAWTHLDGTFVDDDDQSSDAGLTSFEPAIGAATDRFALPFPVPGGIELRACPAVAPPPPVELTCGDARRITAPSGVSGTVRQTHALASAGVLLVTAATDQGDFYYAVVTASTPWVIRQTARFNPTSVCLTAGRGWAVAPTATGFAVAWRAGCTDTVWQYVQLDTQGVVGVTGTIDAVASHPSFGAARGEEQIFASCTELVRVDAGGGVAGRATLPGAPCAIAGDGSLLRWAELDGTILRWHPLDPESGVGLELLALDIAATDLPAVAADDSGFALVWPTGGNLGYAYVAACPP